MTSTIRRLISILLLPMFFMTSASLASQAVRGDPVNLTAEERAWLHANPEKLTLYYNTEFPPIEYISESGTFIGMGADVIARVEDLLDVAFVKIPSDDWNEHLAALKSGECAIAPTIVKTAERENYAFFTLPYATVPVVIITTQDITDRLTLDDFKGRRIGVVSGYATEMYLRDQALFTHFEVVPVANVPEGLQSVSFGQIDAFAENLAVAAYYIDTLGIPNLRVAGTTNYVFAWSIGVSREYPLLYSAIQKALDAIPKSELEGIRKQWIALEAAFGMDPEILRLIKMVALFAALLLLSLGSITIVLKRRLNQKVVGLRESEERFRLSMEAVNDGVWDWDILTDHVSHSPGYFRMLGYEANEVAAQAEAWTGKAWADLIHPEDKEQVLKAHQDCIVNRMESFVAEYRMQAKDGSWRWILGRGRAVDRDASGRAIRLIGTHQDITERKRAEQELEKKRKELELYFTSSLDLLCIANTDGKFVRLNPEWESVLGYSISELEGRVFLDFVHPEDMESTLAAVSRLESQEDVLNFTNRYRCKDGSYRWIEWRSRPLGRQIYAVARDITDRKRMEEALLLTQFAMDQAPDSILWVDEDGRIVYANNTACSSMGYTREELLAKNVFEIDPDFPVERWAQHKINLKQCKRMSFEGRHRTKDGRFFPVEVVTNYIENKGRFLGIAFDRDISDRKRLDMEREKLQSQLLQAQKMESVGILAGGVAHDFNNLLHAMRGNIELLLQGKPEDHPDARRLRIVTRSMDRAAQLVRQLLLFSRKAGSRRVRVDLNQEVEEAVRILERTIPRMVALELRLDPSVWPLFADPVQIEQILLNLANNSVDAMPSGGRLVIETGNVILDEAFTRGHPGAKPGRHALLTVTDTGCGMDNEVLQHVFDPFFTTKEVGKGTGLGLASVYGIVKAHGGHIQCCSEPGKGTTFRVYLPAGEQGEVAEVEPLPESSTQGGHETILVVDDEQENRELTREGLEVLGYSVKMAVNGEQALDIYIEHGKSIDLVLLDLNMPGMGGHKCLKELLRLDPEVKVVIASGYTANSHSKDTLTSGAKAFLGKPFQLKELATMVRGVLDEEEAGAVPEGVDLPAHPQLPSTPMKSPAPSSAYPAGSTTRPSQGRRPG